MHINNDQKFFKNIFIPFVPSLKICIFGDTLNHEKVAFQIKQALLTKGYLNVYGVDKEMPTLASLNCRIDLLVLCMHPARSLPLITGSHQLYKTVIIQPGAESPEILSYLKTHNVNYTCGCILKYFGLK